jgi:hypothetical protein
LQEIVVEAPPPPGSLARMRSSFQSERGMPATESAAKPAPGGGAEPAAPSAGDFGQESDRLSPSAGESHAGGRSKVIVVAVVLTLAFVVAALALARRHSTSPARSVPAAAAPAPRPGAAQPTKKH